MTEQTAIQHLTKDPAAFVFDAALRLLQYRAGVANPADAARFTSRPNLAYAAGDVLAVDTTHAPPKVTLGLLGLAGSAGVLPRSYSEQASSDAGEALHSMLDLLAHGMLAGLGRAGMKYRLDRAVEGARLAGEGRQAAHVEVLLAVAGFAEADVASRLPCGSNALLHYAGLFALRPRSAERLAALASDWLGQPVEVLEFAGAWLPIEPDQRTRLGKGREAGRYDKLGGDAAVGTRVWDPQARVVLRVGPLDRAGFEALLPNGSALKAFAGLVQAYLGFEVAFAVNPILAACEVPPAKLDAEARPGVLLGWNAWLGRGRGYVARGDADDARFAGETLGDTSIGGSDP